MNPNQFSHMLQKKGILKNFSIAKVVPTSVVEKIKEKVRGKTKTDAEFDAMLEEEMKIMGNMHDKANPIPGIIYNDTAYNEKIVKMTIDHSKKLKTCNFTKDEMCIYIMSLTSEMGLTRHDFNNLDFRQPDEDEDDDEDDDEDEVEDAH